MHIYKCNMNLYIPHHINICSYRTFNTILRIAIFWQNIQKSKEYRTKHTPMAMQPDPQTQKRSFLGDDYLILRGGGWGLANFVFEVLRVRKFIFYHFIRARLFISFIPLCGIWRPKYICFYFQGGVGQNIYFHCYPGQNIYL